MPDQIYPQAENGENSDTPDRKELTESGERFRSDSKKIVDRHLEDQEHEITEEEMRSIRIGVTPPELDEATEARFGGDEAIEKAEDEFIEDKNDVEEDKNSKDDNVTPWDAIK